MSEAVVRNGGEHELVLVGPAAIEHRDPGLGAYGDRLHCQLGEADIDQFIPGGIKQRGFELLTASAAADVVWRGCGHFSQIRETCIP
jgi:hypothetical protein